MTLASLALFLLVSWATCRVLVRATGAGVMVRTPLRTTTYAWDEVQGLGMDDTGSHLVVLTRAGAAPAVTATFTRHLRKRVRLRTLGEWAARIEAARPELDRLDPDEPSGRASDVVT